jgi:hypothetical protein
VVVAYLKVLRQHLIEGTGESHENYQYAYETSDQDSSPGPRQYEAGRDIRCSMREEHTSILHVFQDNIWI